MPSWNELDFDQGISMDDRLHSNDFQSNLHTAFRIDEPIQVELQLAEVLDSSNEMVEQFSLIFAGPASAQLQQGTYTLKHPTHGAHSLFLVPLEPQGGLMRYQAVFSHLCKK
jgi:hypothetical protein